MDFLRCSDVNPNIFIEGYGQFVLYNGLWVIKSPMGVILGQLFLMAGRELVTFTTSTNQVFYATGGSAGTNPSRLIIFLLNVINVKKCSEVNLELMDHVCTIQIREAYVDGQPEIKYMVDAMLSSPMENIRNVAQYILHSTRFQKEK